MNSNRPIPIKRPARAARGSGRRGVAMALVLIALGVGTILAGAALSSRENSPAIGQNVRNFAVASWSAKAGAAVAMSVLESNIHWQAIVGGNLLTNFPIAGGTVTATITNLQGAAPTPRDREIIMTITSTVGGMVSTQQRIVSIVAPGPVDDAVSDYLDEFAAFAVSSMTIEDGADIKAYHMSPEVKTRFPIKLGTGFSALGGLNIGANAKLKNVALNVDASGSVSLQSAVNSDLKLGKGATIPMRVPAYPVLLPTEITSLPVLGTLPIIAATSKLIPLPPGMANVSIGASGKYGDLVALTGAVILIDDANGGFYQFNSISVGSGGKIQIKGRVTIFCKGILLMSPLSNIELVGAGSAVRFLTGEDVFIDNATFGLGNAFSVFPRNPDALSAFYNPAMFRLLAVNSASGGKANPVYTIRGNSVVLACIHAPTARVRIEDNSSVIGRVTAGQLELATGSRILYEPRLDSRIGYSACYGPLYENKVPLPEVLAAIASYVPGEGAVSISHKIKTSAKNKWALTPETAWFIDENGEISSDPFGAGSVVIPLEPETVEVPITATPRFAGRVFSAPIALAAASLEDDDDDDDDDDD